MTRKNISIALSAITLVILSIFYTFNSNDAINTESVTNASMPDGEFISVERVIDGDTIKVTIDGRIEKVRIIGINTPETKDPNKPIECFGPESSFYAEKLLTNKKVLLEFDDSQGKYDKYQRLLAYVWLEQGELYSELAIRNGFGFENTYDGVYKYQIIHKNAQAQAKKENLGIWKNCPDWPNFPETSSSNNQNECDPNYSGACVPISKEDLDCSDINAPVNIIGIDIHRLDRDGDKKACLKN